MTLEAAEQATAVEQPGAVWRIELFGGLRLHHQGHTLHHFKTRRMTLLLARLACFPNRAHPRDTLAEELWPDETPDTLRERFRQTLSMLRRELEPEGVPSGSVLIADRSAVRLASGCFSTDVADFEAACRAAKEEQPARQIELLQQASALYRGELLPGFYEDWILTEREHLAELHRQALNRLTTAYAALGQWEPAIETARKVVTADPLCEDSHCALIRVFAQAGRAADAKRQYEELEHLLRAEMEAEPGAATQTLMVQVRSGALTAPAGGDVPVMPSVSGVMPAPSVSGALIGTASSAALPVLPVPMTRFFGREEEIARLVALLPPVSGSASLPPPLVTLTGPGGAGKTRLALEVARLLGAAYGGAVWFVPLADVAHPGLIADAIVETLAVSRSAHAAPMQQAVECLQTYPAALLILDNFEHLQEEGTPVVQALRQRLPRLSCLVTSRHKLNVEGERDLALPPLQIPEGAETPEALLTYPGIQLFLDRAQAARYSFLLTADNAHAVSLLGQRLEGLPLAIELAAAWAATLAPEQILQRLSRRFDLLVSRRKDVPQRHQSLQAVLEGSYQLLPPKLQRLYARLSVFRGGWTLEAAEKIASVSAQTAGASGQIAGATGQAGVGSFHCLDGLAVLQERSFVQAEERAGEMRYRLLESLREFGAEQLESEERFALAQSHAAYFLALTEEAQARQRTKEEKRWFDRLEAEYDNLRAALEWAIANAPETALKMAAYLGGFWMTRGFAREGNAWLEKALSSEGEMPQARAEALNYLALMKLSLGDYEHGKKSARESIEMLRRLADKQGTAKALNTLGALLMEQGEFQEAQNCYAECLSLYRDMGNRLGESIVLANLGNLVYSRGEYALACTYYSACLETRRALGDLRGIAAALDYLGRAVREQGDYARACDLHAESLAMRRELNDKQSIALALNHLGAVKTYLGECEEARKLLEESLAYSRETGDKAGLAEALSVLGELSQIARDVTTARAYWSQSLAIEKEAGDKSSMAALLEAFAGLAHSDTQFYEAAQMLGAADTVRREISNPVRPSQRSHHAQTVATVRAALGIERFQQAWAEGQALTLEQALRLTQ